MHSKMSPAKYRPLFPGPQCVDGVVLNTVKGAISSNLTAGSILSPAFSVGRFWSWVDLLLRLVLLQNRAPIIWKLYCHRIGAASWNFRLYRVLKQMVICQFGTNFQSLTSQFIKSLKSWCINASINVITNDAMVINYITLQDEQYILTSDTRHSSLNFKHRRWTNQQYFVEFDVCVLNDMC